MPWCLAGDEAAGLPTGARSVVAWRPKPRAGRNRYARSIAGVRRPAAAPPAASCARMNRIRAFGRFWWDFVVGDDWRVVAALAGAIGAVAVLAREVHVASWWLLPVAVAAALYASLDRASR